MVRILVIGFTKLSPAPATIGADQSRILQVSVSAITPSAPIAAPQASAPQAPDPTVDASAGDAGAAQPTPPPPLPPGQGTRVDQLA
jgi:hypothetical protein